MRLLIESQIRESIRTKELLLEKKHINSISKAAEAIAETLKRGGKLIVFGNGGSAADAQHFAAELVGRFKKERKGLPAISLTTNASTITAVANDYSYDVSFSRQLEAFATPKDIVVGISTSGQAKNVIAAVTWAKKHGIRTIALTGKDGGKLAKITDISLIVPSMHTPAIQESHITIIHAICAIIDEKF